GNVERMIISNIGNVGIGTTGAPPGDVRLTVNGGANFGVLGLTSGVSGAGVFGKNSGNGPGVRGESPNGDGRSGVGANGVFALSGASNGAGVFAVNLGGGNGVFAQSVGGIAGFFSGSVTVTGTVTKGGGSFKIDHPVDPENKYLSHSFVESPDMMNVYNGNITLDARGEAWVTLPDWFEALNRDFRYQLTPIGAPANLYIAEEVIANRFKIAGGLPNGRVSWQVTGVRQDRWANAHRISVEEDKPDGERGFYLHPDAFGQTDDMRIPMSRAHPAPELIAPASATTKSASSKLRH